MNIGRGMFRLWIVASCAWVALWIWVLSSDYLGLIAVNCAQRADDLPAGIVTAECYNLEARQSAALEGLLNHAASYRTWLGALGLPLLALAFGKVAFWIGAGFRSKVK